MEGDEKDEDEGEGVCICPQSNFMNSTPTHHFWQPEEQQDTLTHLLIVSYIYLFALSRCIDSIKPNGAIAENEADYEEDDDDDDEDEDGDDDYVEEEEEDNAANALHKKRSIDEVADKEASQGSKKIKVWRSKPPGALPPCIKFNQPPEQVECASLTM